MATLGQFAGHLETASERLSAHAWDVLLDEAAHLERNTRANIEARLTVRTRQLLSSVRVDVRESGPTLELSVGVGGDYQGLRVRYARLQEEGGTIRPTNARALAIPVGPALTGPGVPKYPQVSRTPHLVMLWPKGARSGVLVNRHTGEVWYVLVHQVTVRGKHFLRDAALASAERLPARIDGAVRLTLEGQA